MDWRLANTQLLLWLDEHHRTWPWFLINNTGEPKRSRTQPVSQPTPHRAKWLIPDVSCQSPDFFDKTFDIISCTITFE